MGISSNLRQSRANPYSYTQPSAPVSTAAPPPFEFAPRPQPVAPYVTPPRQPGSGTGAVNAFNPPADPVQAFLSMYPATGNPGGVPALQQQMQQAMTVPPAPVQPSVQT